MPEGQLCRGRALALLERYQEAEAAYAAGLAEQPTHEQLQQRLQQLRASLVDGQAGSGGAAGAGSRPAADGCGNPKQTGGQAGRRLQDVTDDTECTLCMRLFYDPGAACSWPAQLCSAKPLLLLLLLLADRCPLLLIAQTCHQVRCDLQPLLCSPPLPQSLSCRPQ